MSFSPESTDQPPSEAAAGSEALVRLLREELIKTQMIVLDLNDRVLEKETEKADAVAILGQVELVLEQKINYITELDRALNGQLAELRARLETTQNENQARETSIQDLLQRLDAANKEVGRMHGVAGDYARDLAHTREALNVESATHQQTRAQLAATSTELATTSQTLAATQGDLASTRTHLAETQRTLQSTEAELARERHRLNKIFRSALWKLGRPWRALFGPQV
jgi:chromosome segregation ATPase